MDFAIRSAADIAKLSVEQVCERFSYVDKALRLLRAELGDRTALIGFSGSPWTLATFMMEGASVPKYSRVLALFQEDRKTYFALAEKLTAAVTAYLRMQIVAGIDALQIFDSHGGHLAPQDFQEASGRWMKDIITALGASSSSFVLEPGRKEIEREDEDEGRGRIAAGSNSALRTPHSAVPIIVFSLGTHGNWPDLVASGANVLGVDWQSSLAQVRQVVPEPIALQGNLPPALLSDATPEVVAAETRRVLGEMRGRPGHIFNLGHGLTPNAKLENIAVLVETVRSYR
jgi:uroporphyrinogen decarboxylase